MYRAKWAADEVRDDLQAYVMEHLSAETGVLVLDETGFLKKGQHSVGVQVQYCVTARGKANCQIGIFLTYVSDKELTFVDRALYLPTSWTSDRARCRAAGLPAQWVTGDSVYGSHSALRHDLESMPRAHVLGISPKDPLVNLENLPPRVSAYLSQLPQEGWVRLSAGAGAKGVRGYDGRLLPLGDPDRPGWKRGLRSESRFVQDQTRKLAPLILRRKPCQVM